MNKSIKNGSFKKLSLATESLRQLGAGDLRWIAGGDSGSLSCTGPDCSSPSSHRWNCKSGKGLDD